MRPPTRSTRPTPGSGSSATPTGSATAATSARASRSSPTARAPTPRRRAPARCRATSTSRRPLATQQRAVPRERRRRGDRRDRQWPRLGGRHRGHASTFHNTGSSTRDVSALSAANLVNVPATTPLGIWTQERNDPSGGNEMQWTFPVAGGHQHPGAALLRQPVHLDPTIQRAHRRRHQADQLRPERRPGRQQGHDEVLRHHQ